MKFNRRNFAISASLLILLAQAACSGTTSHGSGNSGGNPATVSISVSPNPTSVRAGGGQTFTATVSGTSNTAVTWQVNGTTGGSVATGTIDASGSYAAPSVVPASNVVTIEATSAADPTAPCTATLTLLNPVPVLSSIAPTSVSSGNFSLTVNGSGFVSGAKVLFAGSALATNFVSSAKLTATGTASSAGSFGISVLNPNPGSSSSTSANLQVTAANGGGGGGGGPAPSACSAMTVGQGGSLNGFVPFPSDNPWNTDISSAPVDPNSTAMINFIGASVPVHPDFGSGLYNGSSMGIPYVVVGVQQAPVAINFTAYGDESDPGPMPVPATAPIEGYPAPGNGDRHVLVLDNNNCWLYELYSSYPQTNGSWNADSAAVWDLTADENRPYTWTSADAAGLPIFPGLARYDEVAAGAIHHALRFTLQSSKAAFTPPASHWASNSSNSLAAPMGMRLRLKASFDISSFSAANQVILTALKKYGMIMADNGSSMYISGGPDDRWSNDDLHNLSGITASDFEVVKMNPVYTSANVPQGSAPSIGSFTASSQSVSAGTQVTLNWSVTGASYLIVSPDIGAVRGSSVIVTPTQSATYTLYATNAFGRTTATVNITVH